MIYFAKHLFISESLRKKEEHLKEKISKHKMLPGIYIISFSSNKENLFDIMSVNELLFPAYQKMEIGIVGIAKGQEEAIEIAKNLVEQVYNETKGFDVRAFYR